LLSHAKVAAAQVRRSGTFPSLPPTASASSPYTTWISPLPATSC